MEENINNQKTCHDAGDISDSIFQFLTPGEEQDIEGNITWPSLMPSLAHMSVVKIVTALWNRATVQHTTVPFLSAYDSDTRLFIWKKIEAQVLADASAYILPECSHKMLMNAVKPIGNTILKWAEYLDKLFFSALLGQMSVALRYIGDLVWTSRGRIDYAKTAKALLTKAELSYDIKYQIACNYCLEDDIIDIAAKVLPRGYLEHRSGAGGDDSWVMTLFWTRRLMRHPLKQMILQSPVSSEVKNLKDNFFNELIFSFNSVCKNPIAMKHMWQKLSNEEKELNVACAIEWSNNADLMIFFLTQVSVELRDATFKRYSVTILGSLITDWLWKDYFLPTVRLMWKDMSGEFYFGILCHLLGEVQNNPSTGEKYSDSQEKRILASFWKCSPDHLKQYAFEHRNGEPLSEVLAWMFSRENANIIQLILSSFSRRNRKQMILSKYAIKKCAHFITSDQSDLLDMFVVCTLFCKDDFDDFKKSIAEQEGDVICFHFVEKNEMTRLDQFLGWCFESQEEIDEFMHLFLYKSSNLLCTLMKRCVVQHNGNFAEAENFLRWIFTKYDVKEFVLQLLKQRMVENNILQFICNYIVNNKVESVKGILKSFKSLTLCFNDDLSKSCFSDQSYDSQLIEKILALIKHDASLPSLCIFFYWWLSSLDRKSDLQQE